MPGCPPAASRPSPGCRCCGSTALLSPGPPRRSGYAVDRHTGVGFVRKAGHSGKRTIQGSDSGAGTFFRKKPTNEVVNRWISPTRSGQRNHPTPWHSSQPSGQPAPVRAEARDTVRSRSDGKDGSDGMAVKSRPARARSCLRRGRTDPLRPTSPTCDEYASHTGNCGAHSDAEGRYWEPNRLLSLSAVTANGTCSAQHTRRVHFLTSGLQFIFRTA